MAAHRPYAGLDFGTTNTALGLVDDDGHIALAPLPNPGKADGSTWRTVLFFEPDAPPSAGNVAIDRFMQAGGEGRLIQSIKSHLASAAFKKTVILGRAYTLETLIATYLRHFISAAKLAPETKVVVGRPVRYWGAQDDNDEALALDRMRDALASAGFGEAVFEYEPVAAALRYAAKLDHQELVMVADFGGGTSDFSLVRVGPKVEPGDRKNILATSGLGIGGDSFDARVIDAAVAPELGLNTTYKDEFGARTPVPAALFGKLRRWHYLSFLKDARTLQLLERIEHGTDDKQKIGRMLSLVRDELGLPLHRAVEQAKVQLSASAAGALQFPDVDLNVPLERQKFEGWIGEELTAIDATIDDMLAKAGVTAADVDTVFATGGSSLVPVVRQRLTARFGAQKLLGGEELTSVAWGLAARARQLFG